MADPEKRSVIQQQWKRSTCAYGHEWPTETVPGSRRRCATCRDLRIAQRPVKKERKPQKKRTHCHRNHEYALHAKIDAHGRRFCNECRKASLADYKARHGVTPKPFCDYGHVRVLVKNRWRCYECKLIADRKRERAKKRKRGSGIEWQDTSWREHLEDGKQVHAKFEAKRKAEFQAAVARIQDAPVTRSELKWLFVNEAA